MSRRVSVFGSASFRALRDQTFEVACSCGEVMTGSRQLRHQVVHCPHCGKRVFVLPADSYAGAVPRPARRPPAPAEGTNAGRVIDKLNRLAFWTRLRERRTNLGGQLCSIACRAGRWLKTRLAGLRG